MYIDPIIVFWEQLSDKYSIEDIINLTLEALINLGLTDEYIIWMFESMNHNVQDEQLRKKAAKAFLSYYIPVLTWLLAPLQSEKLRFKIIEEWFLDKDIPYTRSLRTIIPTKLYRYQGLNKDYPLTHTFLLTLWLFVLIYRFILQDTQGIIEENPSDITYMLFEGALATWTLLLDYYLPIEVNAILKWAKIINSYIEGNTYSWPARYWRNRLSEIILTAHYNQNIENVGIHVGALFASFYILYGQIPYYRKELEATGLFFFIEVVHNAISQRF
jgi:hypothetical protein